MVLGLGSWEIVLVGLALLVLFGPEHAPRALRTLGRWQTRLRSTMEQIEKTLEEETAGMDEDAPALPPWRTSKDVPPEAETWALEDPSTRYAQQVDEAAAGEQGDARDEEKENSDG